VVVAVKRAGGATNTWVRHFQSPMFERAQDSDLPLWQRVAFLAWAKCRPNGHATFRRGELARFFAQDRANLQRAIREAVTRGWIDPQSCAECLVPNPHEVQGGWGGDAEAPCAVHERKAQLRRERKLRGIA
jgi:hypothetical protein